ncbi:MAG: phage tail assembly chaperone [Amphiplicatus sp.]
MNLSRDAFWSLSLAEWRWLLAAAAPSERLCLAEVKRLAAAYPDQRP